jgi:hypothetical protein
MNEVLRLSDGTDVKVLGIHDDIRLGKAWEQTVHVGNAL